MRLLNKLLPLIVLLLWGTTAKAQYNPENPPEPGVNFTLSARCVPSDAGRNIYGIGTHSFGSNVDVRVTPTTGYKFLQWVDQDGTVVSTESRFTYTMPAKDVTLIAHFVYDPTSPEEPSTPDIKDKSYIDFKIVPDGAGYIRRGSSGKYEVGSTQYFEIRENNSYRFVKWTLNGIEIGTSRSVDFTVPSEDAELVANFVYDPSNPVEPGEPAVMRNLTLQSNLEGAASLSGGGRREARSSFTVSARANTYFHFVNWTDEAGDVVSESSSFTYTMPDRNVTLTANYTYNYDPSSPGEPGTPNPDGSIAENMVLWPRMGMYDDTHVQILCETPGATIHYTLDGSTPNAESPVYTDPVFVPSNLLVKAIAYKEGMEDSPVVSYQVTAYKTATPVFRFENLKLNIISATPDAIIRYTTDFTDPTQESDIFTTPFLPEENCRIKAYASKEGLTDSPINFFVFRSADYTIPAPTFSIDEEGKLVIIPSVSGGVVRYTLDGTDPDAASTVYTEPLALDGNFTVRAYTTHVNFFDSPVGEYILDGYKVATPTFSYSDLALTLATATPGATIRYTLDGSIPSETSAAYTEPLRLTEDCKVTARGFKANYEPSETVSYTFVYTDHQVATPTMTYDKDALTVTVTCATENAQIRYTIDGDDPTESTGTVYEGPIAVTGNHTYRARAFLAGLLPSEVSTLAVNDRKVPTPTAAFANGQLTLSCADEAAEIRYTIDGEAPTESTGTVYEGPIALTADCTVRFIAIRENYVNSEIALFEFKVTDYQVAAPVLTYDAEAKTITMTCATANAEIRYTIDGEAPTAETGIVYTAPIPVTGNHTYTARAFRTDLFDSEASTVAVTDLKVAQPVVNHSLETLKVTMTTATEGAAIRYTTDGNVPTESTGTLYTAPIDLNGNVTYTVRAFLSGYIDSDVTVYEVSNMKLPMPTATYGKHALTLACEDGTAQIRYTVDGTEPTATSALYSAPIALTADCTVRFIAVKTGYVSSEEGSYNFVLADWQEAMPTISKDFSGRKITINQANSLPVNVTVDGTTQTLPTPATLDVTPAMTSVTAVAIARNEDRYDSPVMTEAIVFHKAPKLTSDGHTLQVTLGEGEPSAEGAERQLFIDGTLAASGAADLRHALDGFCAATARVQSNSAFISDVAELSIDAFNTGRVAAVRNGRRLAEVFGTWGDKAEDYGYLRLRGELAKSDIETIAALPQLATLHIEADTVADDDYSGILAGARIETIFSNAYPEGMLKGMPRLTTVMWGRTDRALPDGRLTETGNPNLLFWTPSRDMLPEDAYNIVEYDYAPDGAPTDPEGKGVSGEASMIHLLDGYPFRAHMPVKTGYINFRKTFTLPTEIDVCAGWETIVLPFDADTVSHERQGVIVPFAAWDGQTDPWGGIKPFWLYSSTEEGWEEAAEIKAGVPYIISMPNNPKYVESSNLYGEVTFWTAGEVMLGTPESAPKTTSWKEGSEFTGTFMPVEEEGILSMNVKPEGDELAGSAFTAYAETLPFGAYMWAPGQPQSIPVFPDGNGVMLPTLTDGGLMVETPAPGTVRVTSPRDCRTAIVTPDGATVRTLSLRAGESVTVEGLTRGLYIVGGVKVMVR